MKINMSMPLALLIVGAATTASAVELPTQKPGLWQVTMKSQRMSGGPRTYQVCEDAAFLAEAKASAESHMKKDCSSTTSVRKVGDTYVSDADCKMSGMHIVSHSVTTFHGDDSYHSDITSTMDAGKGKKSDVMTMDNKWLGACKAGQKVGVPSVVK